MCGSQQLTEAALAKEKARLFQEFRGREHGTAASQAELMQLRDRQAC